jgi:Icc-related predicted phosphoesterase
MLLRVFSDCHFEFYGFNKFEKLLNLYLPKDERDKEATLVMAGDVGTFHSYETTIKPGLKYLSKRFKNIIYVAGNHCFYNGEWWIKYKQFWEERLCPKNVYFLDDDIKIIDDVAFIGSTLWTNFNNRDPLAMFHAEKSMNDFRLIKYASAPVNPYGAGTLRISAEDTVVRHEASVEFIKQSINVFKHQMQTVVVTHHLPSMSCVDEMYRGDLLNHAFASNLDEMILHNGPNLWIHGHSHSHYDAMIGDTRLLRNTPGYHASENPKQLGYQSNFFVEI